MHRDRRQIKAKRYTASRFYRDRLFCQQLCWAFDRWWLRHLIFTIRRLPWKGIKYSLDFLSVNMPVSFILLWSNLNFLYRSAEIFFAGCVKIFPGYKPFVGLRQFFVGLKVLRWFCLVWSCHILYATKISPGRWGKIATNAKEWYLQDWRVWERRF